MALHEYLKGVFPVAPTPLMDDETLDPGGMHHLLNYYIASRCHGVLVLGSGGEFPYFTAREKLQIVKTAVKAIHGRIPLLVGVGFNSARETLAFVEEAGVLDIDGFLVIQPTYYPVAFPEMKELMLRVCGKSKKPVLYYHYPQMTGLFFSRKEMSELLSIKELAGMKESSMNMSDTRAFCELTQNRTYSLLTGNSFFLLKSLQLGAQGAICQIPAFSPEVVVNCYEAWISGERELANHRQELIQRMIPVLNTFGLPAAIQKTGLKVLSRFPSLMRSRNVSRHAVVKEILHQQGHPVRSRVRSPLPQISVQDSEKIRIFLSDLKSEVSI
ncbi:MAG: dihydrodipicolinate synthase family protein [Spirochaetes bacterium]|nr:MAG: dihydrodipicolinate synthase family protein [Spirochaetota bacterium]